MQPNDSYPQPELWGYDQFKAILLESARRISPHMNEFPTYIDIGPLQTDLDKLNKLTAKDGNERALSLKTDLSGNKLLIAKDHTVGTDSSVVFSARLRQIRTIRPQYSTAEQLIGTIHTHPDNTPASPADMTGLVKAPEDNGTLVEFLGTRSINFVFLRTQGTPEISAQDIPIWLAGHDIAINAQLTMCTSAAQSVMVNHRYIKDIVEQNKIAVYTASAGKNIYTKASL